MTSRYQKRISYKSLLTRKERRREKIRKTVLRILGRGIMGDSFIQENLSSKHLSPTD